MIVGIGIDHVEIAKFKADVAANESEFLARVFTDAEISYARSTDDYVQRLAGRFAAKEAALKALGTGWSGNVDWKQIEITNDSTGQPRLALRGYAADLASKAGVTKVLVSISHSSHLATAEVILEG